MGITDELRKYAQDWRETPNLMDDLDAGDIDGLLGDFEHIADRIDAEHEAMLEDARKYVYAGYVELPKDANGVPIHVGDVVDVMPTDKFTGHKNVVVTSVIFKRSASLVTVDTADRPFTFRPNRIRHHHAPTVEDVLREFFEEVGDGLHTLKAVDTQVIIAKYAAKLRLAGGAS